MAGVEGSGGGGGEWSLFLHTEAGHSLRWVWPGLGRVQGFGADGFSGELLSPCRGGCSAGRAAGHMRVYSVCAWMSLFMGHFVQGWERIGQLVSSSS